MAELREDLDDEEAEEKWEAERKGTRALKWFNRSDGAWA